MHWISSEGGPFVLTTSASAKKWRGVKGSSMNEAGQLNDYDKVCEVENYAELVSGYQGGYIGYW